MNDNFAIIITNIKNISSSDNLDEMFFLDVLNRLESLGYVAQKEDSWVIAFSAAKVENHIKNSCNTIAIPEGLLKAAIERVCGEVLFSLKQTGKLEEQFDLSVAVKQIQIGDTNTVFDVASVQSPEQRLNALINYLLKTGECEFACYRKLKW